MNLAVSKLQRDIWKTETSEQEDEEKKERKTKTNNKTDNNTNSKDQTNGEKSQTTPINSQAGYTPKPQQKQSILDTLVSEAAATGPPISLEQELNAEKYRQTEVSRIRRSIFKLAKSSKFTEYYPPELPEAPVITPEENLKEKLKKIKAKEKIQQPVNTTNAQVTNVQPSASTKNPRSKALARRQESKDNLLEIDNDNIKENKDKENDDVKAAGANTLSDKRELQRMKGIFFCEKCQKRWKSIHVYCEPGTKHVVYGQICESCKNVQMPKRVSRLRCVTCSEFECDCPQKREKLLEPKMVHRADLCVKCLSGDRCVNEV